MELDPELYNVVWIAPLPIEARAAAWMLDVRHAGRFPKKRDDHYVYLAGEIWGHNVVIVTLPGGSSYESDTTNTLARHVKEFFPNLRFGLLVGVASGIPRLQGPSPRDIRLGDVLVAWPDGDNSRVVILEPRKTTNSKSLKFLKHNQTVTGPIVVAAIKQLKEAAPADWKLIVPYYDQIKDKEHSLGTFMDPGQDEDQLYLENMSGRLTVQTRAPRPQERRTHIWYGSIGSIEKLPKDLRRNWSVDDRSLIGLEMDAAAVINVIPVAVIRGVSDYCDGHKNKGWQPYAAATAAAYAKAVLERIKPRYPSPAGGHIPVRRNPNFTGRFEQLNQLERMLFHEDKERMALSGLAGIGKTQVALELAYRVRNKDVKYMTERYSVFWLQARSIANLHEAAEEVVRQLGGDQDNRDPKEALQILWSYLRLDAFGPWLLVIDDFDDDAILHELLVPLANLFRVSRRTGKGKLLITTRQYSIAARIADDNIIRLSRMALSEAKSLLEVLLLDNSLLDDTESVTELLKKLLCLPLSLALAATYINKTGIRINQYLEMQQSADQDIFGALADDDSDIESVLSAVSLPSSVSSIAEMVSNAIPEWAALLLNDDVLSELYPIALSKIGPNRFQRNFTRFLRNYSQNLSAEVSNPAQLQALRFARQSAGRTSAQITQALVSEHETSTPRVLAPEFAKSEQIDQWLASQLGLGKTEDMAEDYDEDEDGGAIPSPETPDADAPQLQSLNDVKSFMVSAAAFETLRREFRSWLKVDKAEPGEVNPVQENPGDENEEMEMVEQAFEVPTQELNEEESGTDQADKGRSDEVQNAHRRSSSPADDATPTSEAINLIEPHPPRSLKQESWSFGWWSRLKATMTPLTQGYTRLFYTCSCGDVTYFDVKETSPGGIDAIRRRLHASANEHAYTEYHQGTSAPSSPRLPPPVHARPGSAPVASSGGHQPITPGSGQPSRPEAQPGENVAASTTTSESVELQFLLVCIDVRRIAILTQVEVSSFTNDQFMFKEIHNIYEKAVEDHAWKVSTIFPRWLRTKVPDLPKLLSKIYQAFLAVRLHRVASGDFVRFQLVPVGEAVHPTWFRLEFPPQSEVVTRRHIYQPVPMDVEIVNIPLAHLLKAKAHHDSFWLSTFPRKLNDELRRPAGSKQPTVGWGIRINQTLNWAVVLAVLLFMLVVISIIVVIYAAAKGDDSAAFGLGAYLAAILTVWLTYHYFSWQEAL
ncbi:hypothetical protein NLG97_g3384 [Lecanicillium saksenae]|uniref:Uncharacterized protein n=1 Tax=Lecanicillium saksenae TaxID=468837 RepID=A0ACC1QY85_9HYPO|nr:hypothetical protein NLG97_g3384 [Lecanicillium saksenae]